VAHRLRGTTLSDDLGRRAVDQLAHPASSHRWSPRLKPLDFKPDAGRNAYLSGWAALSRAKPGAQSSCASMRVRTASNGAVSKRVLIE
jgi:hypothetical protein